MKGRITRSTGSWYYVMTESGEQVECRIKGKFRLEGSTTTNPVAVGDKVYIEKEPGLSTGVITEIYPRENYIIRRSPRNWHRQHVIAANLDQAVLIITFSMPRTSLGFIDRFTVTAAMYDIPVVLVFNKQDIYKKKDKAKFEDAKAIYESLGYTCLLTSAETGYNMDGFKAALAGKTSLIAGHSGVGKSSLINSIEPDLQLDTKQVSNYNKKGMHTTTFAAMHALQQEENTFIIDTPGIKEFGLLHLEPSEVGHYFKEIKPLMNDCYFNNCLHRDEPDCAIKEAIRDGEFAESRYINYLNILESIEDVNYWER